tara:strand:- start:1862 stop:2236 length:375 start_codon:yes stop_codon:yes gene_type:complete
MELYKDTNVKELKFKDIENFKKITLNKKTNNNRYGILIFYSSDCKHCKESVHLWSEIADNFKTFNIFAYNIYDYDNDNEKLLKYLSVPELPKIMSVTKKGTLYKFKEKIEFDNLFYYISKKLKL